MKNYNNIIQSHRDIILADTKVLTIGNHISQPLDAIFKRIQYDLGCTYILYIYEDSLLNRKIIYSTNWKWQNLLVGEKLINDCPVFKAATAGLSSGKKSIILPWNHIHSKTTKEKDITLLRAEFNIANGIGISYSNGHVCEGIGFGADVKDINFYQRMIANNLIYSIMRKIKLLALRNAKYLTNQQRVFN